MDPQTLVQTLSACLSPVQADRKAAEAQLAQVRVTFCCQLKLRPGLLLLELCNAIEPKWHTSNHEDHHAAQLRVRLLSGLCQHCYWRLLGGILSIDMMLMAIAARLLSVSLHAGHLEAACLALS